MTAATDRRAALAAGLARLGDEHPALAAVIAEVGTPEPRILEPGFGSLLRIVVGQQVSTAAAAAIWDRLADAGGDDVARFLGFDDATLGRIGLSRAKMRYGRALAAAVANGTLDPCGLANLPGEEATARLTALPGIGRWTAEIYRMFALGDPDVFPVGDLALREGVRMALGLEDRPPPARAESLTAAWRPERSAAALLLWRLYRHRRGIAVLGADGSGP
ncbi:3-methyladenine DNA glycosylase [Thalassobaculum fulvum]|uniref:DNA-3-methyladenine glycosylase II n=1 Tax=Thalassobaculum fulvum TaxID=1633335 RepID=A0A918XRU3_9PROT|nr:DNA-3-methyladenine glycosylase 2 family protein [Thalassobaculum fulvum]GHD50748.1 3-methyladenine DNA glycosylase [Thalassobaculum fulvum]